MNYQELITALAKIEGFEIKFMSGVPHKVIKVGGAKRCQAWFICLTELADKYGVKHSVKNGKVTASIGKTKVVADDIKTAVIKVIVESRK